MATLTDTVDLFGTTYQIDFDTPLHREIAAIARDLDSARARLETELARIKKDADRALDQLRDGHYPNPLGPIHTETVIAAHAAEYAAKVAQARTLLHLAGFTTTTDIKYVPCDVCNLDLPVTRREYEAGCQKPCPRCGEGADLAFHNRHVPWDD